MLEYHDPSIEALSQEQLVCVIADHLKEWRLTTHRQKPFTQNNVERFIHAFLGAISRYDERTLRSFLYPDLPIFRYYFSALTGVALGRTANDMLINLFEWARVQTPRRAPLSGSARSLA